MAVRPERHFDEFDLEAMREADAIKRSYKRAGWRPKNGRNKDNELKPGEEFDRLVKYDVIHGRIES